MSIHIQRIKQDLKVLRRRNGLLEFSNNKADKREYKTNQQQIKNLKLKLQELENEVQNV